MERRASYTRGKNGGFSSALERENEGGVCNIGDFTPPSLPFGCWPPYQPIHLEGKPRDEKRKREQMRYRGDGQWWLETWKFSLLAPKRGKDERAPFVLPNALKVHVSFAKPTTTRGKGGKEKSAWLVIWTGRIFAEKKKMKTNMTGKEMKRHGGWSCGLKKESFPSLSEKAKQRWLSVRVFSRLSQILRISPSFSLAAPFKEVRHTYVHSLLVSRSHL